MSLIEIYKELWKSQRLLMLSGLGLFVLTVVLIIIAFFDSAQILGINRWIKPIKFAVSTGTFLWTLAIYFYYLPDNEKAKRFIAWGASAVMVGEVGLIIIQALRGQASHFNINTAFNAAIFSAMGVMIIFNTFLISYLAYLYFRADVNLPKAIVWGMRLGLVIFLIGSVEGGYMSSQTGHAVGLSDGGAGLPIVNWSTEGGDLRVAHFIGLHALQTIPLFSVLMVYLQKQISLIRPLALTFIFAILYFASFTLVFAQSLLGKPLLKKESCAVQEFR